MILPEQLLAGDAEALVRKAIELALSGDTTALRLCIDRILPPLRSWPVGIPITKDLNIGTALDGVTLAMAAGTITPQQAEAVANVLEARHGAGHITAQARIAELEAKVKDLEATVPVKIPADK